MIIKMSTAVGYKKYNADQLKAPNLQLQGDKHKTYLNNAAMAQIIHLFQPTTILDLGCYLGGLCLMVEDLLEFVNSDHTLKSNWVLVDNFKFLKKIAEANKNYDNWVKTSESKSVTWLQSHVKDQRNPMARGIIKNFDIPTDPESLTQFLTALANQHSATLPNFKIFDSIDKCNGIKFNVVGFDLEADAFGENLAILENIVSHLLADDGVIVLDDVSALHVAQLALFIEAVTKINLELIGSASNKVLLMKKSFFERTNKDQWLTNIYNQRALKQGFEENLFFWFLNKEVGQQKTLLKLLPNETHKYAFK